MNRFLEWLQGTSLAVAVAEDWFPAVESLHVIAMAMVAGTIFIVDTRLVGLTSTKLPFTYVSHRLLPWTWGAFAFAVVTGTLMFMGNAVNYYGNGPFRVKMVLLVLHVQAHQHEQHHLHGNGPFRVKMVLLVLVGLNMLVFQLATFRGVAAWDSERPPPAARVAGLTSIGLWACVIGFGRWIGFV